MKQGELSEIRELETRLVKLRLRTRHLDFTEDYDRSMYSSKTHKSQTEIQQEVLRFLESQNEPIKNGDLVRKIIKTMEGLSEKDFEKTTSGAIKIYSGIRTALVDLRKKKIISDAKEDRGYIILTEKVKTNE